MSNPKYIVVFGTMLIFDAVTKHSDVARRFGEAPTSAGFLSFGLDPDGNPTVSAYGKSVSLGISSQPSDTKLARQTLGFTIL